MFPYKIPYHILLGSTGWENLGTKFEGTRGIYVGGRLHTRSRIAF